MLKYKNPRGSVPEIYRSTSTPREGSYGCQMIRQRLSRGFTMSIFFRTFLISWIGLTAISQASENEPEKLSSLLRGPEYPANLFLNIEVPSAPVPALEVKLVAPPQALTRFTCIQRALHFYTARPENHDKIWITDEVRFVYLDRNQSFRSYSIFEQHINLMEDPPEDLTSLSSSLFLHSAMEEVPRVILVNPLYLNIISANLNIVPGYFYFYTE